MTILNMLMLLFLGFDDSNLNGQMDPGEQPAEGQYAIFVYPPNGQPFYAIHVNYPAGEPYELEWQEGYRYRILSPCAEFGVELIESAHINVPVVCNSTVQFPMVFGG